jgi:hypothetical protein
VEEGLWWWKTGEVDAWVMGMKVRCSSVDGRDKRRTGEEKDRLTAGGSVLRGAVGRGRRGERRMEAEQKRERE